jgi:hypothetical protein
MDYLYDFKTKFSTPFLEAILINDKVEMKKKSTAVMRFKGYVQIRSLGSYGDRRGPRGDVVIYDEEREAKKQDYEDSQHVMSGTAMLLQIHLSTPFEASVFHKNYLRLKAEERHIGTQLVFERPWDQIPRFLKHRAKYERIRDRLKREGREWEFRVEYECKFEMPHGRVFTNVIYDPYPADLQKRLHGTKYSGLDWNPVAGHWLVGGYWLDNYNSFVVTDDVALGFGESHKIGKEFYNTVRPYFIGYNMLVAESGGINDAFCDRLNELLALDGDQLNKRIIYEEWDSQGLNKYTSAMFLRARTLFIDEVRFPDVAEYVRICAWDEDATEPKIKKDPAASHHPLDALLHATKPDIIGSQEVYYKKDMDHYKDNLFGDKSTMSGML